jgi:hypothetical protein
MGRMVTTPFVFMLPIFKFLAAMLIDLLTTGVYGDRARYFGWIPKKRWCMAVLPTTTALADAYITYSTKQEYGTKTLTNNHPLYKIFR